MGTRSLTHVLDDGTEAVLVTIYRQMDGYPDGHGADLADFLRGRALVNGFGAGTPEKASNGMGCLAASLVRTLKGDEIGSIYLEPPGSEDHGEEYVYTVASRAPGSGASMKVEAVRGGYGDRPRTRKVLFEGLAEDFDPAHIKEDDGE